MRKIFTIKFPNLILFSISLWHIGFGDGRYWWCPSFFIDASPRFYFYTPIWYKIVFRIDTSAPLIFRAYRIEERYK